MRTLEGDSALLLVDGPNGKSLEFTLAVLMDIDEAFGNTSLPIITHSKIVDW